MADLNELARRARAAAAVLAQAGTAQRDDALKAIADALSARQERLLEANREDLLAAQTAGMTPALQDRLRLTPERIWAAADGVRSVAALPDPLGRTDGGVTRPNGLNILRVRVPLGVVGMIYEARPNVTVDAAALTLKSGNACILRGGKEALRSNEALMALIRQAVSSVGLPEDCCALVADASRESAFALMKLDGGLDVLIPRGGRGLIRSVVQNATVPVIETGSGNCHVYVDESADLEMAARIIENAKASRPSVCNAAETLLVHRAVAEQFLPLAKKRLDRKHVELRGCPETRRILGDAVRPATDEDWATEYLDYILAVRVVENVDEAIRHINRYGTGHSEAIVTENYARAQKFLRQVDAAAVYVNASTRFTDGFEFGLGAEIGISTQKLHARGPMGLEALTTTKYEIYGSGQIRT